MQTLCAEYNFPCIHLHRINALYNVTPNMTTPCRKYESRFCAPPQHPRMSISPCIPAQLHVCVVAWPRGGVDSQARRSVAPSPRRRFRGICLVLKLHPTFAPRRRTHDPRHQQQYALVALCIHLLPLAAARRRDGGERHVPVLPHYFPFMPHVPFNIAISPTICKLAHVHLFYYCLPSQPSSRSKFIPLSLSLCSHFVIPCNRPSMSKPLMPHPAGNDVQNANNNNAFLSTTCLYHALAKRIKYQKLFLARNVRQAYERSVHNQTPTSPSFHSTIYTSDEPGVFWFARVPRLQCMWCKSLYRFTHPLQLKLHLQTSHGKFDYTLSDLTNDQLIICVRLRRNDENEKSIDDFMHGMFEYTIYRRPL